VKRRAVIPSVIGLIGVPGIARAQPAQAPGKIGYLHPRSIAPDSSSLKVLRPAWQMLGYARPRIGVLDRRATASLQYPPGSTFAR
jgi:hypothetical protein